MKYVTPRSSSVGKPNPRVMRELLDFLYRARQELAARKVEEQAQVKSTRRSEKSIVVKTQ
jgi:hypothetical protein